MRDYQKHVKRVSGNEKIKNMQKHKMMKKHLLKHGTEGQVSRNEPT